MRKNEFTVDYYDDEKGGMEFYINVFFKQYPLRVYLNRLVKWGEILSYDLIDLEFSTVTVAANNEVGYETEENKEVNLFDYIGENKLEQAERFHKEQMRFKNKDYYKPLWTKRQRKIA